MRRRLYFVLPDLASARATADDLLLARIEYGRMRFLAKRGTDLGELHEASFFQKTDLVHGAGVGFALGAGGGLALGAAIVFYPPAGTHPLPVAVLITVILGSVLGTWMSSMVAASVPNSRLRQYHDEIERGKLLLMVDVPFTRVAEVQALVTGRHPEAVAGGLDTRYPAFP